VNGEEAAGAVDRLGVILGEIIAERAHQLRAARPDRIRMLALDLVEQGRRRGILTPVEPLLGGAVERVHVAGDVGGIGAGAAAADPERGAAGERSRGGKKNDRGERTLDCLEHGLAS
jgi:hypothetical protein